MYAVFYFVGIYFTLVEGYPASQAGTQLLYYIPGIAGSLLTHFISPSIFTLGTQLPAQDDC